MTTLQQDDVQGLIATGYGRLPYCSYVLLRVTDAALAKSWLRTLTITRASQTKNKTSGVALNVAFTYWGLNALKQTTTPVRFAREFYEGMSTPHRRHLLGDLDSSANDPATWAWRSGTFGEDQPPEKPVHILLMLYAGTATELDAAYKEHVEAPQTGVELIELLATQQLPQSKEHFGFHDGISNPRVAGLPVVGKNDDVIMTGEIVLGYKNFDGQLPASPYLPATADPHELLPRVVKRAGDNSPREVDLGKNGTYLVLRQLEQDVPGFWQYMTTQANTTPEAIEIAAKMIGRWPDGTPVTAKDKGPGSHRAGPGNPLGYSEDTHGDGVPMGAHIRRTNPRDNLLGSKQTALDIVRHHRLLRRGRAYGPPLAPTMKTEDLIEEARNPAQPVARGLYFICLNADIARQFEFVQTNWLNNPKFMQLSEDVGPAGGQVTPGRQPPGGTFTVPAQPLRRAYHNFAGFVKVRGGAYFFLPGIKATEFISSPDW